MKTRTLAGIQGCNTEQIGAVPAWTGLPQLVLIPRVPQAMKRLDARLLVAFGLALFAASDFANVDMSAATAADQLFWPNVVRSAGPARLCVERLGRAARAVHRAVVEAQHQRRQRRQIERQRGGLPVPRLGLGDGGAGGREIGAAVAPRIGVQQRPPSACAGNPEAVEAARHRSEVAERED